MVARQAVHTEFLGENSRVALVAYEVGRCGGAPALLISAVPIPIAIGGPQCP